MRMIERLSWDGVVVVGGGVTGLLTALRIAERGVPVLVIESRRLAGGQTSHAHGWLHRGHVFPDIQQREVDSLRWGASWWEERISRLGVEPITKIGMIGFSDRLSAKYATSRWASLGLPVERTEPISRSLPFAYRTKEWSVSPVQAVRAVAMSAPAVMYSQARVVRLRAEGPYAEASLALDRSGRQSLLKPRSVVIAAGSGTPAILQSTGEPPQVRLRQSYMLVARSETDTPAAVAVPEQAAKGLFGVKRDSPQGRHLLFSNFLSFAGRQESVAARRTWIRSTVQSIRRYLPALAEDPNSLWGWYPAVKSELGRAVPLGVPGQGLVPTGARNAIAVLPGKFTSAPVVAAAAAETAIAQLGDRPHGPQIVPDSPPGWANEDYEMTPLRPLWAIEGAYE